MNWITTNWLVFVYQNNSILTGDVFLPYRKSETGLPRDPPLAAFGEVCASDTTIYGYAF